MRKSLLLGLVFCGFFASSPSFAVAVDSVAESDTITQECFTAQADAKKNKRGSSPDTNPVAPSNLRHDTTEKTEAASPAYIGGTASRSERARKRSVRWSRATPDLIGMVMAFPAKAFVSERGNQLRPRNYFGRRE